VSCKAGTIGGWIMWLCFTSDTKLNIFTMDFLREIQAHTTRLAEERENRHNASIFAIILK